MDELTISFAFFQGVVSFFSPCFLPLLPAYLSFLAGQGVIEEQKFKTSKKLLINSVFFVLGFTIVFVLLGATATALGSFLIKNISVIRKVGGIFIILFGLYNMGILKIPMLLKEKKIHYSPQKASAASSLLLGISFSFGWSACIGPFLAPILTLSAYSETVSYGMLLLFVYSLGLAIPFLVIAIAFKYVWKHMQKIYKHMNVIKIISGVLLVLMGILIFMNRSYLLINLFQ